MVRSESEPGSVARARERPEAAAGFGIEFTQRVDVLFLRRSPVWRGSIIGMRHPVARASVGIEPLLLTLKIVTD